MKSEKILLAFSTVFILFALALGVKVKTAYAVCSDSQCNILQHQYCPPGYGCNSTNCCVKNTSCTPCDCASSTCIGSYCTDSCGNTCSGTYNCSSSTPPPTGCQTNAVGSIDGNSGTQTQSGCNAYGWAVDWYNTATSREIQLFSDGSLIYDGFTNIVDAICNNYKCGFNINIWNLITHNTNHNISLKIKNNCGSWVTSPIYTTSQTIDCISSCKIQGYKTILPSNTAVAPATLQTVTLDGTNSTTADPYYFNNVTVGNHTVSVTVPAGYSAGYTLCTNNTTCHGNTPTPGSSVSLNSTSCPIGGYADLWWEYTCIPPAGAPGLAGNPGSSAVVFTLSPNTNDPAGTSYYVRLTDLTTGADCFNNWAGATRNWTCYGSPGDSFQGTAYAQSACGLKSTTTTSATYTIFAPAWWQVKDSDISTNGDLRSSVPSGKYFDLAGNGGYPGVPAYGGGTNLSTTNVSTQGWMAASGYLLTQKYDSSFFLNTIPSDAAVSAVTSSNWNGGSILTSGGTLSYGYYWYEYDASQNGNLDLSITNPVSLGTRKVVFIVKGANINVGSNITLTDGSGFLLMVAGKDSLGNKGNITVSTSLGGGTSTSPNLQGIFVADNKFDTGPGSTNLYVKGSIIAYGGVTLQRSLGSATNGSTPAEVFEYSPALELLFPKVLSRYPMTWKEVAP